MFNLFSAGCDEWAVARETALLYADQRPSFNQGKRVYLLHLRFKLITSFTQDKQG